MSSTHYLPFSQCPVCAGKFDLTIINEHVNQCLLTPAPIAATTTSTAPSVHPMSTIPITTTTITTTPTTTTTTTTPTSTSSSTPAASDSFVAEQERIFRECQLQREQEERDREFARTLGQSQPQPQPQPQPSQPPTNSRSVLGTSSDEMLARELARLILEEERQSDTQIRQRIEEDRLAALRLADEERRIQEEERRLQAEARRQREEAARIRREEEARLRQVTEDQLLAIRMQRDEEENAAEQRAHLQQLEYYRSIRDRTRSLDTRRAMLENVLISQHHQPQYWIRDQIGLFDIRRDSTEWVSLADRVAQSMPRATITRIRRNQQPHLWMSFRAFQMLLSEDHAALNELQLFYSSSDSKSILRSGFSNLMVHSLDGGMTLSNTCANACQRLIGGGQSINTTSHTRTHAIARYPPSHAVNTRVDVIVCRVLPGTMVPVLSSTRYRILDDIVYHSEFRNGLYTLFDAAQIYPEYLISLAI